MHTIWCGRPMGVDARGLDADLVARRQPVLQGRAVLVPCTARFVGAFDGRKTAAEVAVARISRWRLTPREHAYLQGFTRLRATRHYNRKLPRNEGVGSSSLPVGLETFLLGQITPRFGSCPAVNPRAGAPPSILPFDCGRFATAPAARSKPVPTPSRYGLSRL